MTELASYDTRSPYTEHARVASVMFEEFLAEADGPILNVAAGRTNLQNDLNRRGITASVVSLDPAYAARVDYNRSKDGRHVAATAEALPFRDESFAVVLCQYGLQHMWDVPGAVREMIRVTETTTSVYDDSRGTILLNPVFGVRKLTERIYADSLQDVCGIQKLSPEAQAALPRGKNSARWPTLVIKKTSALTSERVDSLVEAIADTKAMKRGHRSLAELGSRACRGASII